MKKPKIHFAHANSFPARTYNRLFYYLADEFEIDYLERHGHNPRFPVSVGWQHLTDELREEIEKRYGGEPVVGVGHSLGGILHFLAAVEKPELYRAVVLLDAPIVSRLSAAGLKFLRKTNLIEKLPLVRAADSRRSHWKTKAEAFEHFRRKEKFNAFDETVLRDYVEHGTIAGEKGIELFFEPKIESQIYQTIPHDFSRHRGKLRVPAAYIGGTRSREARLARLGFMRRNFSFQFYFTAGSHLFPFEKPEETARLIKIALANLIH
ncbi:MAG TPA: alpha/beta hydrolase [Pyrinomonadaceae bacterium]|jgi:pimeloyl-ACP methyl ester carboxylesterase